MVNSRRKLMDLKLLDGITRKSKLDISTSVQISELINKKVARKLFK